jgi:hypothetical protein
LKTRFSSHLSVMTMSGYGTSMQWHVLME